MSVKLTSPAGALRRAPWSASIGSQFQTRDTTSISEGESGRDTTSISRVTTPTPLEGDSRIAPSEVAVASEPPDLRAAGYPPGSPTRAHVMAELDRRAKERGQSTRPAGHHEGRPPDQATTDGSR
jgi:hypothetical protein